jgi:L-alanine-DL-glutamate epimerase-like enolase superfamily enzyme
VKIVSVKTHLLRKELACSMRISRGGFKRRQHAIVEVTTDDGLTGLGEGIGTAPLIKSILDHYLAEKVIGLDPRDIDTVRARTMDSEVYFERMGSVICAASAIEMACFDIKAKALGKPVYELLGGLKRDKLEAYASDVYWQEDPQAMAERAREIKAMGFRTIKAHIGVDHPQGEAKRIAAMREAVGSEVALMMDLNAGYDVARALEAVERWEEFDLAWIEEPVSPNDAPGLAQVCERARGNVAAGENEFREFGFRHLFELNAVDVAMPDIGRAGGLQETKAICELADRFGVLVSPHNFSSGVLLAATMHLMAATQNTILLEMDTSGNAIYESFFNEPLIVRDGFAHVPRGAGLGVSLKPELVREYAVH